MGLKQRQFQLRADILVFFFFLLYALSGVLLEGPISAFGLLCVKTHQPVEEYSVMTNAHTQC